MTQFWKKYCENFLILKHFSYSCQIFCDCNLFYAFRFLEDRPVHIGLSLKTYTTDDDNDLEEIDLLMTTDFIATKQKIKKIYLLVLLILYIWRWIGRWLFTSDYSESKANTEWKNHSSLMATTFFSSSSLCYFHSKSSTREIQCEPRLFFNTYH